MQYEETGRRVPVKQGEEIFFQKMEEVDPGKLQAGEPDGNSR